MLTKEEIEKLAYAKYPVERSKYADGWYDKAERLRTTFIEGIFVGLSVGNKFVNKHEKEVSLC